MTLAELYHTRTSSLITAWRGTSSRGSQSGRGLGTGPGSHHDPGGAVRQTVPRVSRQQSARQRAAARRQPPAVKVPELPMQHVKTMPLTQGSRKEADLSAALPLPTHAAPDIPSCGMLPNTE